MAGWREVQHGTPLLSRCAGKGLWSYQRDWYHLALVTTCPHAMSQKGLGIEHHSQA